MRFLVWWKQIIASDSEKHCLENRSLRLSKMMRWIPSDKHKAGFHAWEEIAVILGSTIKLQIHFIQVFSITWLYKFMLKANRRGVNFPSTLWIGLFDMYGDSALSNKCPNKLKKIEFRGENNLSTRDNLLRRWFRTL